MTGLVGIDEAGRGPVLGSMFVAGVFVTAEEQLPNGVQDSKQLSAERREQLAEMLREHRAIEVAFAEVTPADIDGANETINDLTASAASRVLDALIDEDSAPECVLDACDVDPDRFASAVAAQASNETSITAKHRADATEPVVSAASIIAKSEREHHVSRLVSEYGSVGSGYPSDPRTRSFLSEYVERTGGLPDCARRSWKTSQDVLAAADQSDLSTFS